MESIYSISEEMSLRLVAARDELSPVLSKAKLREVKEDSLKVFYSCGDESFAIIACGAFTELAKLEGNSDVRRQLRRKAISTVKNLATCDSDVELLVSYANSVTNHFYDNYAREDTPIIKKELADIKRMIKSRVGKISTNDDRINLLTQLSSVLRCQSLVSRKDEKIARLHEAVKASERAIGVQDNHPFANMEYGQALWSSARHSKSDEEYFSQMSLAECALKKAYMSDAELPALVLARFYRQTYRPAQAVDAFLEYENRESQRRRLLSETFTIAEAAMQLWYAEYPAVTVNSALNDARRLLEESIDTGYESSRIFVDLALVEAANGEIARAEHLLSKLARSGASEWINVIKDAQDAITDSNISVIKRSFALGLAEHSVWNSLGTYAHQFLTNDALAASLYETGLRLAPKNAVILTNLARVYGNLGGNQNISLAKSYLKRAANYADKSFTWWRGVSEEISKSAKRKVSARKIALSEEKSIGAINFKALRKNFVSLEEGEIIGQERGRAFENIFTDLLAITYGTDVIGRHKIKSREVDAAFDWDGSHYRVETKWESSPSGTPHFDTFEKKLNTAEVRGLFVSMSGFTKEAVDAAQKIGEKHVIMLMDGNEVRDVFAGKIRLETVLELKLRNFDLRGNPYFVVTPKGS